MTHILESSSQFPYCLCLHSPVYLAAIEVANYEVDLCLRWSERGTDHRVSHSSLLGACDKVKLEGKAKEELKVRDGRGEGCVVRDSCPNWHIQYERFDTINSHSYRCTRHRSLVGALSGKGVQRKQGPLAKVCDPPWIPHSRSGKEKHWQIDKGLRVVSGDADRSFRCFPVEGRCKLKLAMTVLR